LFGCHKCGYGGTVSRDCSVVLWYCYNMRVAFRICLTKQPASSLSAMLYKFGVSHKMANATIAVLHLLPTQLGVAWLYEHCIRGFYLYNEAEVVGAR
jgi:hypothetical protein